MATSITIEASLLLIFGTVFHSLSPIVTIASETVPLRFHDMTNGKDLSHLHSFTHFFLGLAGGVNIPKDPPVFCISH
jgi:hypothetical protein